MVETVIAEIDIQKFLITSPHVIWMLVLIGSVAVIGIVEFVKNWTRKKGTKWVVLIVSLAIAIVLSPLTPPLVSTIIILWLLILAFSTIARNALVDGMPYLVTRFMGSIKPEKSEEKEK